MTDRPKTAICILASVAATLLILLFVAHLPRYLAAQAAAPTSCLGSPQAAAERSGGQSICPPAAPTVDRTKVLICEATPWKMGSCIVRG